jgi:hypothetical protein
LGNKDKMSPENRADLYVTILGHWAYAFVISPEAQRMLCEEIARIVPSLMRVMHNLEGYEAEYHVEVYPAMKGK